MIIAIKPKDKYTATILLFLILQKWLFSYFSKSFFHLSSQNPRRDYVQWQNVHGLKLWKGGTHTDRTVNLFVFFKEGKSHGIWRASVDKYEEKHLHCL
jgi:hypothetical protein